jgi:hypothetical protein
MNHAKRARAMSAALVPFVNAVLLAQIHTELMREKMRKLDLDLLDHHAPTDRYSGGEITDPDKAWHMTDADAAVYYADRTERLRGMGYNLPDGHCPALIAEGVQMEAERLMIGEASKFMPGLTWDNLTCHPGKLKEAIRLLIGLTVNAPGYKAPKIMAA